jgi:hypothetical protein
MLGPGHLDGVERFYDFDAVLRLGPVNEKRLHFAAGSQARWQGVSDEHNSTMEKHRLRRGVLHLPARGSRQSANVIY